MRISNFFLAFLFLFIIGTNTLAQQKKSVGGIHYSIGIATRYTELSLLGLNLFYEYKFNERVSLRSNLNINYFNFVQADEIGGKFERLESTIFFSIEESANYYFENKWNNFTTYLGLGMGYFLFDNYLTNQPRGSVYDEYLIDNFGYHILGGIINVESGFSVYLKYLFIPTRLYQYKSIISEVYTEIDVKRYVALNIFNFGIGYTF